MSEKIQRKLDAAEALNNMLLLCGEPELDDLTDPASRLHALIDGLITQRNRADAAEAEIARLKERKEVRCSGCGSTWTSDDLAAAKSDNATIRSCCPEREALNIDEWKARAERAERNRDMWKGQCERQAAQLQLLRTKDAG